ncbi:MAG TPA: cytochrome P450, partial [Herpetosiphonaceae bacterium]|nr:cytochrome P450 [Herpetosiphonaceae bacterium]
MATVTATIARRRPPGPAGHPIWGSLGELAKDPPRFYLNAHRRYGDVVSFRSLGPFRWYMVCHPEDIERILRGPAARFPKDDFTNRNFRFLLGDGLFTSAGDSWLRQRRLAQPAFHRQRLAGLGAIMTATASAAVERWRPLAREGEVVDVAAEMSRLTLQIV